MGGCFRIKLNTSFLASSCLKLIGIDNEYKICTFYEKHMDKKLLLMLWVKNGRVMWFGSVVGKINKVFPGKQCVLTHSRVCLLLRKGRCCYRLRRAGEKKHKSVWDCIVDANLSVLKLVIVKKGKKGIPGLIDTTVPRHLGPKRARESANISASLKKIVSTSMWWESP